MANVKRNKRSRLRGRRTCGWGSRKKHRGSGNRGGVGWAGTGKKAGQKLTLIRKYYPDYFGKKGFHSLKAEERKASKMINLKDIALKLNKFKKEGIAKPASGGLELNLAEYKILGEGEAGEKLIITAKGFSEQAKKKIEAAGGKAIQK